MFKVFDLFQEILIITADLARPLMRELTAKLNKITENKSCIEPNEFYIVSAWMQVWNQTPINKTDLPVLVNQCV